MFWTQLVVGFPEDGDPLVFLLDDLELIGAVLILLESFYHQIWESHRSQQCDMPHHVHHVWMYRPVFD